MCLIQLHESNTSLHKSGTSQQESDIGQHELNGTVIYAKSLELGSKENQ